MDQLKKLKSYLEEKGVSCFENEPLNKYTSFRIGGPARLLCLPKTQKQLEQAIIACRKIKQKFYLLG